MLIFLKFKFRQNVKFYIFRSWVRTLATGSKIEITRCALVAKPPTIGNLAGTHRSFFWLKIVIKLKEIRKFSTNFQTNKSLAWHPG